MGAERGPFVGPRPFQRDEADRFFGRERETANLFSLVVAHPVVLVYARSGAGKSSLLNAGLIPRLEKEGCTVLPVARLGDSVDSADLETENVFVFNVLKSWAGGDVEPERPSRHSLTEFLNESRELSADLEGFASLRIALLDQFEEIFTTHPERWRDREGFFRQLGKALENDWLLRVVIALREEYLAQLTPFVHSMPENLRTRLRLERLRDKQALAAVTGPLRQTDRKFESEEIARELVQNLMRLRVETPTGEVTEVTGEFVEPVQLQVVCQRLLRELPPDKQVIRREHLRDFGNVDQALEEFYEQALRQAEAETGIGESKLRGWCEEVLLTPAGTRGTVYRGREETGGLANEAVDDLERTHLVRGERRAGARWYELTHDRFVDPIRESNRRWRERFGPLAKALEELERRAEEWDRQGRQPTSLLDERKVSRARESLADPNAKTLGYSVRLERLVENSEKHLAQRLARRRRRVITSFALIALVALISAVLAIKAKKLAMEAEELASLRLAQRNRANALVATQDADLQRGLLFSIEAILRARREQYPELTAAEEAFRMVLSKVPGLVLDGLWGERVAEGVATPDGRWLVLHTPEGELLLRRFNRREIARPAVRLSGFDEPLHSAAVSADGSWLAANSGDSTIRFWHQSGEGTRPGILSLWDSTAKIDFLDFDTTGRWLVAVSKDDQLPHLWRLPLSNEADPTALLSCQGGLLPTEWTAAADLGRLIIACGRRLRLWDLTAKDPLPVELLLATPEEVQIQRLSVGPEGRRLAAVDQNGRAFLYDLDAPGAPPEPLPPPQPGQSIVEVLFLPDGGRLLVTKSQNQVPGEKTVSLVWPGSISSPTGLPEDKFMQPVISPDERLFLGGRDGSLTVLSEEQDPKFVRGHSHPVANLVVSADGAWLLSRAEGEPERLWDLTAPRLGDGPEPRIHRVPVGAPLTDLAVSPDGRWLLTVNEGAPALLWNLDLMERSGDPPLSGPEEIATAGSVVFGPEGRWLVTVGNEGVVRVWELGAESIPTLVEETQGPTNAWWTVVFPPGKPPDSSFHFGVEEVERLARSLRSLTPLSRSELLTRGELITSPDRRWLLIGDPGGVPHLWDLSSPKEPPLSLVRHDRGVTALAAGPDSRWLATGEGGGTVRLWDLQREKFRNEPVETNHRKGTVTALTFSPDGRWLAAGRKDASVTLWDLAAVAERQSLERYEPAVLFGHLDAVTALAFSPDGRRLASVSVDSTVRLWTPGAEAPSGSAVTLRGHQGSVTTVAFSKDGHWLFTGGVDGTARRWNLRLDELIDLACRTAGRNLEEEEWRQVFGDEPYRDTCPDLANQESTGDE